MKVKQENYFYSSNLIIWLDSIDSLCVFSHEQNVKHHSRLYTWIQGEIIEFGTYTHTYMVPMAYMYTLYVHIWVGDMQSKQKKAQSYHFFFLSKGSYNASTPISTTLHILQLRSQYCTQKTFNRNFQENWLKIL